MAQSKHHERLPRSDPGRPARMARAHLLDSWLFVRKIWLNVVAILPVLVTRVLFFHIAAVVAPAEVM